MCVFTFICIIEIITASALISRQLNCCRCLRFKLIDIVLYLFCSFFNERKIQFNAFVSHMLFCSVTTSWKCSKFPSLPREEALRPTSCKQRSDLLQKKYLLVNANKLQINRGSLSGEEDVF